MRICVIGSGYVGLVTAACLADSGNHVVGVDSDPAKIEVLPNWVDTDLLRPGAKDNPVARRPGLDRRFVVL